MCFLSDLIGGERDLNTWENLNQSWDFIACATKSTLTIRINNTWENNFTKLRFHSLCDKNHRNYMNTHNEVSYKHMWNFKPS